ncbi:hypothetical protein GPUN_0758 [Glaciecola punicea ACAM 611]|uniref:Uncharacterized protein n=1 Tax=Glaciecola punicea ACAM 611 TaxID=1121923 RepID=H5T9B9_9ALTE|nr:hypothetical protein GPUN_0758 [Glaciecola punicea ACAM 611]
MTDKTTIKAAIPRLIPTIEKRLINATKLCLVPDWEYLNATKAEIDI